MPVYLPIKPKERLYQEIVDQIQQQILSRVPSNRATRFLPSEISLNDLV